MRRTTRLVILICSLGLFGCNHTYRDPEEPNLVYQQAYPLARVRSAFAKQFPDARIPIFDKQIRPDGTERWRVRFKDKRDAEQTVFLDADGQLVEKE